MVRHFETKKKALEYLLKQSVLSVGWLGIYKKLKGHKNRTKKPYVVCTFGEWLNLS